MKASVVISVLFLQRPHHKSRNDDIAHLCCNLDLWSRGNI